MMEYYKKIQLWDKKLCEQHVIGLCNNISNIFLQNNIGAISYIDIGANVGKVFDLLDNKIIIKKAYLFEPSKLLFAYLTKKYENNDKIVLFNNAVYNINTEMHFDESSIRYQCEHYNNTNLNFGLSKLNAAINNDLIKTITISNFLNNNISLYKEIQFIKIDTENADLEILDDLSMVINHIINKPVIEFEKNYNAAGHSDNYAQTIINRYINCGYKKINIKDCSGDCILIPDHFI